jgi:predicted phosphoribosyltransferase
LAERLAGVERNAVVLALPRGGVPVGFAVAEKLGLPLDVIVVRKIGLPGNPERAMGATAGADCLLDRELIRILGISEEEVESIIRRERAELRRREDLYRAGAAPLGVARRTVILVDDGLATGSTMLAAVRCVRAMEPSKVTVAVPVGSEEACAVLQEEADEVVCLATPEPFYAVGQFYRDFGQVEDEEVQRLLSMARERTNKTGRHLSVPARS